VKKRLDLVSSVMNVRILNIVPILSGVEIVIVVLGAIF
jgi:hypothetical protein